MKREEPLYLETVTKEYLWGREDWVLSCHSQGLCRIKNEGYGGRSLREYLLGEEAPVKEKNSVKEESSAKGENFAAKGQEFPLLIKIIDARESLSVQVHPGDEYARQQEHSQGKTEMWYVLEHEPGAFLYYGLKHKVTENEFRKRIRNGSILEICQKVPVKRGDVFYIPPGMLHAIGGGIRLAEVQQSSNITYRVYDYNRLDKDQQKRQLHVEQAADVTGFVPALEGHSPLGVRVRRDGFSRILLSQCRYFSVWSYQVETKAELCRDEICSKEGVMEPDFLSIVVLSGSGRLTWETADRLETKGQKGNREQRSAPLNEGDSLYVPHGCERIKALGRMELLVSSP